MEHRTERREADPMGATGTRSGDNRDATAGDVGQFDSTATLVTAVTDSDLRVRISDWH